MIGVDGVELSVLVKFMALRWPHSFSFIFKIVLAFHSALWYKNKSQRNPLSIRSKI